MHALLSDPGGDPTRSPYRGLGLLPSALFTASAFSSLGWGGLSFRPRLISYFEAQSHGLPSRYTRLRTPRYRDARGFATVLPGLRLWTGRTCRCLPTHRLGNVNEFHSPPYIPSFRVYLGARKVKISQGKRALSWLQDRWRRLFDPTSGSTRGSLLPVAEPPPLAVFVDDLLAVHEHSQSGCVAFSLVYV